jgi:hopanoid biosynthesis associated protein HpnK
MRKVIVTGDDFGLAVPMNEAIVEAHRRGILTTASLMVGEEAAADAVERARQEPLLRIGLHLALVEGHSILPPPSIPDLVNARGEFSNNPTRAGFNFMLRPGIRDQLEAEIRAQFQAFRKTGLALDHVNAHDHMHLHPRILNLILKVGREYGLRAVRLPNEPPLPSWRASRKSLAARLASWLFLSPLTSFMKSRLRQEQVRSNDFIFGLIDSGAMTTELVTRFVEHLPEGVTEIYFHPATRRCAEVDRTMSKYRNEEEFRALTSNVLLEAFKAAGVERIAFSDL